MDAAALKPRWQHHRTHGDENVLCLPRGKGQSEQELNHAREAASSLPRGCRRSFAWRFELLYVWTRSRNTIEEDLTTNDNIIDIRLKLVF